MKPETIIISSRITTRNFRDFAIFDTLVRQRRFLAPAVFFSIFTTFSIICFAMRGRTQQAELLGGVMLAVALVFPGIYFSSFFRSISRKAEDLKLGTTGRHAYTIHMTDAEDGITITSALQPQGTLRLKWGQLYHAYRTSDCIYLYVSQLQAFLLPDGSANVTPDKLWDYLGQKMTADKLTDRRKRK